MASNNRIVITVSEEMHSELNALSKRTGLSAAWIVRRGIMAMLEKYRHIDIHDI